MEVRRRAAVFTAVGVVAGIGVWMSTRNAHSALQSAFAPIVRLAAHRMVVGRSRQRGKPEAGRFTRAEVDRLLDEAWRRYRALAPTLPAEPTAGSRMNVRLAALTIGMLRALLAAGIERTYAIELVSDVTWSVYKQWGRVGRVIGRVLPTRVVKPMGNVAAMAQRIKPDGTVALSFPFNPPGYVAKHVPTEGAVAFDMVRCPVAAVFREQGAVDLCRASWCDLDYPLAEMQGFRLRRSQTLVEGRDHCDFRFVAAAKG